jgi:hypothetical protein
MSVRAKFKVNRIESQMGQKYDQESGKYHEVVMKTLVLSPTYSGDPDDENKKFWDATPGGELRLNCVNPAASDYFELGAEYYIDITKAQ